MWWCNSFRHLLLSKRLSDDLRRVIASARALIEPQENGPATPQACAPVEELSRASARSRKDEEKWINMAVLPHDERRSGEDVETG